MCRIVPKDIEVLVTSAGGVGTTFLSEFIGKFRRTNCPYDRDGLKHLPVQPISRNASLKILFVVGDPIDQALSLFRRGYHATQARRINLQKGLIHRTVKHTTTIEEYATGERDHLGLAEHFQRWEANPLGYRMLVLKYSAIWDSLDQVYSFLDIPDEAAFPERKERESKRDGVSKNTLTRLGTIYSELNEKIAAYPDCCVLPNAPHRRRPTRIMTSRSLRQLPIESSLFWLRHVYTRYRRNETT